MKFAIPLFGVVVGLAAACGPAAEPTPVRIILVTVDTLRADYLTLERMPRTYAFSQGGAIFENFYAACSVTQPTHASLFTGLPPWKHGVTLNGAILAEEHRTVTEHLRDHGFATAAVVASFPLHAQFGYAQGFEQYHDDFTLSYAGFSRWGGEALPEGLFHSPADEVTDRALSILADGNELKQFLWLHYFDPHDPYGDRGSLETQGKGRMELIELKSLAAARDAGLPKALEKARRLYERDLAFLDRALGRLFETINNDPKPVDTHVIFTADHGESFGESGELGHGYRLTLEQIHVPTFIVSPRVKPGQRSDFVGSADIAATILSLAGLAPKVVSGRDLAGPKKVEGPVFGMRRVFRKPLASIRTDGSQVLTSGPWFFSAGKEGLFAGNSQHMVVADLDHRPAEADTTRRLQTLFRSFERSLDATTTSEHLDEETQRALQKLGYVR